MTRVSEDQALDQAAVPIRRRIQQDLQHADATIRRWLIYIDDYLFDHGLNVTNLRSALGIRNNSEAIFFHIAIGTPPAAYIEQARLDTAARLLRHSDLAIGVIGDLVGYRGTPTFSRAFHRVFGLRPRAYRRRFGSPDAGAELQPPPASDGRGWRHSLARLGVRLERSDVRVQEALRREFEIEELITGESLARACEGRVREVHEWLDAND